MLMSDGRLILADATPQFAFQTYQPTSGINLIGAFSNYGAIYRKQLWVYTVVRKRALAVKRLPLKVYEHQDDGGRQALSDSPLASLLAQPNPNMTGSQLWEWTSSTHDIYGEAIWVKVRSGGRVVALVPAHPTNINIRRDPDGNLEYLYAPGVLNDASALLVFPQSDVVHFRSYNPDTSVRGMSPLEPLRQTLANEDAARRASTALWNNGGRPSGYLAHPSTLSDDALRRLREQWNDIHGGVDNFGKFAILEEGMEPKLLSLSAEELQYIETRKLDREEVCGAYDIPPPVVHILDRATFSNITEQMRSMYRDTMAPLLGGYEDVLHQQLTVPDFGADQYAEFLMDEVLRGDFENRISSYATSINNGILTPNEVRALENLPAAAGGEKLYINSALIPIDAAAAQPAPSDVVSRSFMGRLSRVTDLRDVDLKTLCAALTEQQTADVKALYDRSETVAEFRQGLRDLFTKELTP
jgi:HK97 family phage portal protein